MTLSILPLFDMSSTAPVPQECLNGYTINGLQFIKKIGAGTYGLIYMVQDMQGHQYAAKMVLKRNDGPKDVTENKKHIQHKIYSYFRNHPQLVADEISLDMIKKEGVHCPFLKEISLHLRVHDHPNVVTIHKVLNIGDVAIAIVMDYNEQGDLFTNIIDNQIFVAAPRERQELLMKNAMLQLIEVVQYCHQHGIYHCDLKPENIMVRYNPEYVRDPASSAIIDLDEIRLVLIDFGLAMDENLICCNACRGSSFYMAPERVTNYNTNSQIRSLINLDQYVTVPSGEKANSLFFPTLAGDIWSLGILFINITCSRNPWPIAAVADRANTVNDVFKNYIFYNRNVLSSILPISFQYNHLLDEIFQLNPNDRIPLPTLKKKIIDCDFFEDKIMKHTASANTQLFTPPETEIHQVEYAHDSVESLPDCDDIDYFHDKSYVHHKSQLETPSNSFDSGAYCPRTTKESFHPHNVKPHSIHSLCH